MPKFIFSYQETMEKIIEIEADSYEEAETKAKDLSEDIDSTDLEYVIDSAELVFLTKE